MKTLFGKRVLVKVIEEKKEEITEGGIYLPESVIKTLNEGKEFLVAEVLQVGTKLEEDLKVGDQVYFYKKAGLSLGDNRVIHEADIVGII